MSFSCVEMAVSCYWPVALAVSLEPFEGVYPTSPFWEQIRFRPAFRVHVGYSNLQCSRTTAAQLRQACSAQAKRQCRLKSMSFETKNESPASLGVCGTAWVRPKCHAQTRSFGLRQQWEASSKAEAAGLGNGT